MRLATASPRAAGTRTEPREEVRTRLLPPYNVILENDDHHTQDFVIDVLCEVFHYPVEKSFQLMMEAHTSGRSVVFTGSKEVAELKAEQIQTFHQVHPFSGADLGPLGCTVEPAPGA